jgi:hypothetical protein
MQSLSEEDTRRLTTLFESMGINHLEVYQRVLDELPILRNLIECFGSKIIDMDNRLVKMEKDVNNITVCLNTLLKKWC